MLDVIVALLAFFGSMVVLKGLRRLNNIRDSVDRIFEDIKDSKDYPAKQKRAGQGKQKCIVRS